MSATAVRLHGVSVAYPGGGPALRDVDLTVAPGEFVLLAGGSGSGKSTLLGMLSGLVPQASGGVVHGSVEVGGLDLREASLEEIGRVCAYVGQEPERQVVMTTARAELGLGAELRGAGGVAAVRMVEEIALALGVGGLLDRDLSTLSGGELQRVALGAAMAAQPDVLILDEPTSQLDPVAGDELLGLLRRLNREWGLTVVLAEHRLERCLDAADRVVALRGGAIAFEGAPSAFCTWAPVHAPELATSASTVLHAVDPALAGEAVSVRRARAALERRGLLGGALGAGEVAPTLQGDGPTCAAAAAEPVRSSADAVPRRQRRRLGRRTAAGRADAPFAARLTGVWRTHGGGEILRGIELTIAPGEAVALMGRNGAGKTTLLRTLVGLDAADRGRVELAGRAALVLQRGTDHLLRTRVGDELPAGVTLVDLGLADHGRAAADLARRHPADLSGGQQQVLATAVVAGGAPPALLCLDEPTRGLDRGHRARLAADLARRRAAGTATVVATHDPEFAALVADRVVLLGEGQVLADGPGGEVLVGGWYFATEVARLLQTPGIVTPRQATAALRCATATLSTAAGAAAP